MLTDYCGAGARLTPERGLELDARRWAWMPKVDGVYARISLDRRGRISNVLARSGAPLTDAADLIGLRAGSPDSILHGELEAHTEAGNRVSSSRGWRALHLFDATRAGGVDISAAPFAARYESLHQMRIDLDLNSPWSDDDQGDAHDLRTGRYCRRVPRDVRRLPIVPLARGAGAGTTLWREHVEIGGGEGVVAVRLDAPARARGSKRKIKATDTLDCRVLAVAGGAARLEYGGQVFAVSARGSWSQLVPGAIVEVACDGWYESATVPRFARIVRVRADL